MLKCLLVANYVDVIAGHLIHDLPKVSSNKLLCHIIDYTQILNEPAHTSGSKIRQMRGYLYKDHCSKHMLFRS